jgi:predicted Zn finger-like uncharacterized protein
MPVVIQCDSCATKLKVADEHQGKTVRCPRCKKPIAVPAAAPEVLADDSLDTDLRIVRPGEDAFEGLPVHEKIQKKINDELEEDEQIIWVGQPIREEYMMEPWKWYASSGVVAGIGFIFFAISCGIGLLTGSWLAWVFLVLVLLLFGVGVLGTAQAGYFNDYYASRRPCYVLTDRRVMIHESNKITSAEASFIPKLRRGKMAKWPGAGLLIIPFKSTGFDSTIKLDALENVEAVEQLIRDVLLEGKRPS